MLALLGVVSSPFAINLSILGVAFFTNLNDVEYFEWIGRLQIEL